jgi:small conductance mechanosensitive channel
MPELPAGLAPIVAFVVNALQAMVFLVVGWFVAGRTARFARSRIASARRIDQTLGLFIANTVRYVLLIAVVIGALQTFGFQVTSLVAILGAATLAIGLALQGTLSHLASGIMIVIFRPYRLGDFIQIGDTMGTVLDINLFLTELAGIDGARIYLPNGEAWGRTLTNHSVSSRRRCDIVFGVDYGDDLDKAIGIIRKVVADDPRFIDDPAPPWVEVVRLNESSVDIELRAWCSAQDVWKAKFATLKRVKEAFDAAGISIPFPHRTVVTKDAA